jgi:hypothetical protein
MKSFIETSLKILRAILIIGLPIIIATLVFIWVKYKSELDLAWAIRGQGEVTYLVLFQNTLELRPTGGFIGNFAEVTLSGGRVKNYTIYNTNVFDYGKPGIDSPEPYKSMLGVQQMQVRDANWSANFPTTAKQIIDLYKLEGGTEDISGVIAVNASVLPEILNIIGPVSVPAIDKELTADNVLLELQYELNFGFVEKGISRSERKEPIKDLALEIENRIRKASIIKLYDLGNMFIAQARQKQILFWSRDDSMQSKIVNLNWDGEVDSETKGDYFMLVDANLGALKTDYYMKRSIKKEVNECGDKICSNITITYNNTAKTASPLNDDYKSYTRVLLPQEAFVNSVKGIEKRTVEVDYTKSYNKKITGFQIMVPVNSSKDITIEYTMPKLDKYTLDIQKQPGIEGFDFNLVNNIDNKKVNEFIRADWSLGN